MSVVQCAVQCITIQNELPPVSIDREEVRYIRMPGPIHDGDP